MKAPISVDVRYDNVGTHTVKFTGADGDEETLTVVLPQGSSAYQALHSMRGDLAALVTKFLNAGAAGPITQPEPPPSEPKPAA